MTKPRLGIYGGTFDPIHYGHLRPVNELAHQFGLEKVLLIPCHIPPHRETPSVNAQSRLAMVQLAAREFSVFDVDDREINRQALSYTIQTLQSVQQEYPQHQLLLFIGTDSLNHFTSWYQYEHILALCSLVVCQRPGYALQLDETLKKRVQNVSKDDDLTCSDNGYIYLCQNKQLSISATELRQNLAGNQQRHELLPSPVFDYIAQHALYQKV